MFNKKDRITHYPFFTKEEGKNLEDKLRELEKRVVEAEITTKGAERQYYYGFVVREKNFAANDRLTAIEKYLGIELKELPEQPKRVAAVKKHGTRQGNKTTRR